MASKNRREFLKKSLMALVSLPFAGAIIAACTKTKTSETAALPQGTKAVVEDDPVAASLGYKTEAAKVDTQKYAKRAGPEGEKQFCNNCQFYSPVSEGWGNCQIIRSGVVSAGGWCNTWAAKASAAPVKTS